MATYHLEHWSRKIAQIIMKPCYKDSLKFYCKPEKIISYLGLMYNNGKKSDVKLFSTWAHKGRATVRKWNNLFAANLFTLPIH